MRKSSVLVIVILLLVVMLGVGAVGYLSKGFKDWDYKDWFKQEQKEQQGVKDNEGNVLEPDKVYAMPSSLGFSTVADVDASKSTVNLIATVKPDNATIKNVEWSVEWAEKYVGGWTGASEAVTDFIEITPMADNPNAITVTSLKAFGEKIKIVAKSKDNPKLFVETIVDYISNQYVLRFYQGENYTDIPFVNQDNKRVYDFNIEDLPFLNPSCSQDDFTMKANLLNDENSVCTLTGEYEFKGFTFFMGDEFVRYFNKQNTGYYIPLRNAFPSLDTLIGPQVIFNKKFINTNYLYMDPYDSGVSVGEDNVDAYNKFNDVMIDYININPSLPCVDWYIQYFSPYFYINVHMPLRFSPDSIFYYYNTDLIVNSEHIYVGGVDGGVKYE